MENFGILEGGAGETERLLPVYSTALYLGPNLENFGILKGGSGETECMVVLGWYLALLICMDCSVLGPQLGDLELWYPGGWCRKD